ncbi:MAG: hypothetical protein NC181_05085 [Clostridium sp.]|nr:hypothetical protein [Clostridium sp.]MCM1444627.1 hypothetical protein [Candidatus Amulumruptor caecigallinarius]
MSYKDVLNEKIQMLNECLCSPNISLNEVNEIKKLIQNTNSIMIKLDKLDLSIEQKSIIIDDYNNALDNALSKYVSRDFDFHNMR